MISRQFTALLLVFIFSVGLGLIGVGQTSPNSHRDTRMPAAKAKEAKKLFKQHCVKCHGADGAGETAFGQIVGAADFTDSEWQERVDDQRLVNSMTHGRGQMPSFSKKLSKEQMISLLAYVRGFKR
jgi:mono/diheme cytochrome c family protein